MIRACSLFVCAVLSVACAPEPESPRPAVAIEPPAPTSSAAVEAYLAQPRFADADLARGELLSLTCVVCHTLGPGEPHLIGPNLHGVFGRPAASAAGFRYSPALRAAELVWTPELLDAWLAEPAGFLPGNIMPFAGLSSATDRNALLAYLLRATSAD